MISKSAVRGTGVKKATKATAGKKASDIKSRVDKATVCVVGSGCGRRIDQPVCFIMTPVCIRHRKIIIPGNDLIKRIPIG